MRCLGLLVLIMNTSDHDSIILKMLIIHLKPTHGDLPQAGLVNSTIVTFVYSIYCGNVQTQDIYVPNTLLSSSPL